MNSRRMAPRLIVSILSLSLILPAPAFALRQSSPEEGDPNVLAGLEEALRSPTPDAASEKVAARVANVLKSALPASIPVQPFPATGSKALELMRRFHDDNFMTEDKKIALLERSERREPVCHR